MQNFVFYSPTEVIFGKETEANVADAVKKYGGNRVFVVYGSGSVVRSGLLGRVEESLKKQGIAYRTLGGVKPNPLLSLAREGVAQAKEFGADFVLAVGGGSAIDTAKGIALGAANPADDIWEFWEQEKVPAKGIPVGVVLTISAAGSETSDSAVLTNDETGVKRGLSLPLNRPCFAIMNPELTFTLPVYQVGCGVVDIMMHTMDRYFNPVQGNEITDEIAEAVLRVTTKNGAIAVKNPKDYGAMSELMWCGSLSHNSLTGLGGKNDFAVHQLGHELSARFDVAHGASLSTVWGSWAQYVYMERPERFARYAEKVCGIMPGDSVEKTALAGIEATVAYFRSIGMPTCFTELGIGVQDDEVINDLADRCSFRKSRKIGSFKVLDVPDMVEIYKAANR